MAGFLLHQGAVAMCMHGGQAMQTAPNTRVLVSSMPTSTIATPWTVAGCPGIPPASVPPCVTAQWIAGTARVLSMGQPLVVQSGTAVTVPNGVPLMPVSMQMRVSAI